MSPKLTSGPFEDLRLLVDPFIAFAALGFVGPGGGDS